MTTTKQLTIKLGAWTFFWLICQAIAAFGPQFLWHNNDILSLVAIFAAMAAGLGMVRTNIQHLLSLDEMQQRIHLEAMALTLGYTLIAGLTYALLDSTGVLGNQAEISILVIFMGLCYIANLAFVRSRYL